MEKAPASGIKKIKTNQIKDIKTGKDLGVVLDAIVALLINKGVMKDREEFNDFISAVEIANRLSERENLNE